MVSSASRNGRRLICVTINDGNDWQDHQKLLEQGFAGYQMKNLVTQGDSLGTRDVLAGQTEKVQLLADENFSFPLSQNEQVEIVISGPGFAYAPVVQGQEAGFAYFLIDGKTVGKIPLIYGQTVEQEQTPPKKHFWDRWFGGNK